MVHVKSFESSLSSKAIAFYSLPVFGVSFLYMPIVVVQGIYAKYFGIPLTEIAIVILIARLFDAVSDPLIGYFSDRYMAKKGSRKPFIFVGVVGFVVSSYFLYVPPNDVTISYFAVTIILFYLTMTLFEIPHYAWGGELTTQNYRQRSKLYALRLATAYIGIIFFFSIPFFPLFDTPNVTPETLKFSVIVIAVLMIPMLFGCMNKVPNATRLEDKAKQNFGALWGAVFYNKPLLIFGGAYFFYGAGAGMWFAMLFIFVDGYLGIGEKFTFAYLVAYLFAVPSTFFWSKFSNWFGNKHTWIFGTILIVVSLIGMGFLKPDNSSFIFLLFTLVIGYCGFSSAAVVAPSMIADIADYGRWKFGADFTGTYFSFYLFMQKATAAIGGAFGLALAGVYGFDPSEVVHSADSLFGLRLATGFLPAVISSASLFFILLSPLTRRRHAVVCRRLDSLGGPDTVAFR